MSDSDLMPVSISTAEYTIPLSVLKRMGEGDIVKGIEMLRHSLRYFKIKLPDLKIYYLDDLVNGYRDEN